MAGMAGLLGLRVGCRRAAAPDFLQRRGGVLDDAGLDGHRRGLERDLHALVVKAAVFHPRLVPGARVAVGQPPVDFLGMLDRKIMGQQAGRAVVGQAAAVQHQDRIVQVDVRQAVGHVDHQPLVLARQGVHQVDDLLLGFRVEAAGDLVAEQQGGAADQFHRQPEAALLATGDHLHPAPGDRGEAHFLKRPLDQGVLVGPRARAHPQARRALDAFLDGQRVVGDAELRHIGEFVGQQIALGGEVAVVPADFPRGFRHQPGDGFQQCGLAAAAGPDNRHQVAGRRAQGNVVQQVERVAIAREGEEDVVQVEHGRVGSGYWLRLRQEPAT
jgi:hypothetical protein